MEKIIKTEKIIENFRKSNTLLLVRDVLVQMADDVNKIVNSIDFNFLAKDEIVDEDIVENTLKDIRKNLENLDKYIEDNTNSKLTKSSLSKVEN